MDMKVKIALTKIIDWFIIQSIKIKNFVKEHKYVSSGIGIFLISCIIGLIAFASDDQYAGQFSTSISGVQLKNSKGEIVNDSDGNGIPEIQSFDTVIFDVNYFLSFDGAQDETLESLSRNAIVEATVNTQNVNYKWYQFDDNSNYEVNGNTIKSTVYNIRAGKSNTHSLQLYLDVYNIANGTTIDVDIKVYEETSTDKANIQSSKFSVSSTEVPLTARVISGKAYKADDNAGFNGRYAPYGILVGIDSNRLNSGSLKGLYFNPNVELTAEATQSIAGGVASQIEIETKDGYFGLYDREKNLLDAPHHEYNDDYYPNIVYNSGEISIIESDEGASGDGVEVKSQDLYLIGNKEITLEVGDSYTEEGVKLEENGSAICKTTSESCVRTIVNQSGLEVNDSSMMQTQGTYKVSYTYTFDGGTTTVYRTINIIAASQDDSVLVDDNTYALIGRKNATISKDSTYIDPGVSKNGLPFKGDESADLTITILKDDSLVESLDTSTPGTYSIKYTITSLAGSSSAGLLERTVTVVEQLSSLKSSTVIASPIFMSSSENYVPTITIDGKNVTCNEENNCSVKYLNITGSETSVDFSKPGGYTAVYTVTDKNGFEIVVKNTIIIQIKYKLIIKGINTDEIYNTLSDGFVVLGSYYVNAKSVRDKGINENIQVSLKVTAGGAESASEVINPFVSTGEKTYDLSFINDDNQEISSDDALAYGEEVILKSRFEYSKDGDNPISNLKVRVPVNVSTSKANGEIPSGSGYASFTSTAPFKMIEYYNEIEESDVPYFVSGADVSGVTYYACEMDNTSCNGTTTSYKSLEEFNNAAYSNDNLKLAYIEYSVDSVNPGTIIDFRIRLQTNIGNQGGTVILGDNSSANCEYAEQNNSYTKYPTSYPSINVTAFKARTKVYVDETDQDISINGATTNISTWRIYPSVSIPAQNESTNLAKISNLDTIKVTITLPNHINYVYNDNYDNVCNNSGNTLTCNISGAKVNEWIEPIYFDTSYDVDTPSGNLEVSVVISAETQGDNKIKDTSKLEFRTTRRIISYQNTDRIPFGLQTPYSAISKDTPFDVSTTIYNSSVQDLVENLETVIVLPYNDISNESRVYTGSYQLSNIPNNALCTTDSAPFIMANSDNATTNNEITWNDCSIYAGEQYVGVTAIRISGISIPIGQTNRNTIKIIPIGNKSNDYYEINAFLYYNGEKTERSVDVSIVSKKITGVVWEDFNDDGIMDIDEKRVSGVTLKLYKSDTDEYIKETTSNEYGQYSLSDLDVGKYYVVAEYNTAKYGLTHYNVSSDKSESSSFYSVADPNNVVVPEEDETSDELTPDLEEDFEEDYDDSFDDDFEDDSFDDDLETEEETKIPVVRTDDIDVTNNTRSVNDINLGLSLNKVYTVKLSKFVSKVITTDRLGISTTKDFGNVTLAKLDVKDLANLSIKVIYTIELENVGYYPGYIYTVKDYIPDGMSFNDSYAENEGWVLNEDGYLENSTLFDQLVAEGEKKYLTIAFDVTRKEAGSFLNYASVDDEDLHILAISNGNNSVGD